MKMPGGIDPNIFQWWEEKWRCARMDLLSGACGELPFNDAVLFCRLLLRL